MPVSTTSSAHETRCAGVPANSSLCSALAWGKRSSAGQHAGREPGESVVAQQHVQVGGADCLQPGAGIAVEAGMEVDVGQYPVQDERVQFLQGAHVGIQGRGPSLQLFGQAPGGVRRSMIV
ncbi:hypothetical protein SPAR_33271 [Streptomyces sparsogenes DSM 40356]|uniref:Uncharacterized protein n=1 Tax=Streptomyces sparsogenes DSM 40356 TaxID=1331668 RepID=A0A1R1S9U0_9ACTN|nr:hypothetical protein SPAR_33271 [Streptomyces sparsogenes DSM 40356]